MTIPPVQDSFISSAYFQGQGSSTTGAGIQSGTNIYSDANGFVSFTVNFAVSVSQPFSLNGTLTESTWYHDAPLATINGSVTFSTDAQPAPLYSVSETNTVPNLYSSQYTASTPFSYSSVLQPGQNFTLDIRIMTESQAFGTAISDSTSAGFDFTAVVPEPTCLGMIIAISGRSLLQRQRRRGA